MDYAISIPDDLSGLDADSAQALLEQIDAHIEPIFETRRRVAAMAEATIRTTEIATAYLVARDGAPPASGSGVRSWPVWSQPLGTLGMYPLDLVTRHNNRLWRSDRAANVWEPGTTDAGWTDVTDELTGVDPPEAPVVTADPWSPDMAYAAGVEVSFGGHTYRSKVPIVAGQYGAMTPDNPVLWAVWGLVS